MHAGTEHMLWSVLLITYFKAEAHKHKTWNRETMRASVGLTVIAKNVVIIIIIIIIIIIFINCNWVITRWCVRINAEYFQNLCTFKLILGPVIFLPNFRSSIHISPGIHNRDLKGSHATRNFFGRKV
jgi:hypothetical protein